MGVKILFASSNPGKLEEMRKLFPPGIQILSPSEQGIYFDAEETGSSFEENAAIKAKALFEACGMPCFSDDSGLEVKALKGEPGIKSARYAGIPADPEKNITLLLKKMEGIRNRSAGFVSVVCLKTKDRTIFFEGRIEGEILTEAAGKNGFGYDSVFRPEGYLQSFAEMDSALKNQISHRYHAIQKMLPFMPYV